MSSFICEKCGTACLDTPHGYASGCDHHPATAKPTVEQLAGFCRREYGDHEEYGFACRLQLRVAGIGPALSDAENNLLILLVWAWRDSLIRPPATERRPRRSAK